MFNRFGDFIYRSYLTLNRDLSGLYLLLCIRWALRKRLKRNCGVDGIFLETVKKYPNKIAAIDIETNRQFTFTQLNEEANKYANHFQSLGYRAGDVVGLFMENSVDFFAIWLGLAKLGVISAWINSNLKLEPLAHCVNASRAKLVICSSGLQKVFNAAREKKLFTNGELTAYRLGDSDDDVGSLRYLLKNTPTSEPKKLDTVHFKDVLCFIYTSGTTGMPKAAVIKHFRYYWMVIGTSKSFRMVPEDRIYLSMPLYHTSAGIIGVGQTIVLGCTSVIRRKFSASNFWKDCVKYDCTASQYIGEICRYLLAQKEIPEEKQHCVRLLYGNGLRKEIWQQFVKRFNVQIGEAYGSTEGTSSLVNTDGHPGACGFLPISPLTKLLHPVRLVKVDETTGEVIRGKNGLCLACNPGETGAMVSTIRKENPMMTFEGYLNEAETDKKVLNNVFKRGDSAFITGDILHWDRLGYIYFKDRTGDTFRWKGENVSTTEVEAILHPMLCVADATVYGVSIPGKEGKAGMAAVVMADNTGLTEEEFIDELRQRLEASLALYAIPVFIRICSAVEKTSTFKLIKTKLRELGYQLGHENDHVYFRDTQEKRYRLLDPETFWQIQNAQYSQL